MSDTLVTYSRGTVRTQHRDGRQTGRIPAAVLELIDAAERVYDLVSDDGPPFLLDGGHVSHDAEFALLSLVGSVNDVRAVLG